MMYADDFAPGPFTVHGPMSLCRYVIDGYLFLEAVYVLTIAYTRKRYIKNIVSFLFVNFFSVVIMHLAQFNYD